MSFLPLFNIAKLKNNKDLPKIAEVINNADPKGLGRVRVKLSGMFEPSDAEGSNLPWIRKINSEMGIGIQEIDIPAIGDKVEIIWPYDDNHAFYRGLPFGEATKVADNGPFTWGWIMPNGFKFLVNKATGAFQVKNNKCTIDVSETGKVQITTNDDIIVNSKNAEISASQNTTILSTGNTSINASGAVSLKSTGATTITGSSVTIGSSTKIDGKVFLNHKHSNGNDGNNTGGVV